MMETGNIEIKMEEELKIVSAYFKQLFLSRQKSKLAVLDSDVNDNKMKYIINLEEQLELKLFEAIGFKRLEIK